jgi:cephalosporin hydroxylase
MYSILDNLAILRGTDKSSLMHNYCMKYEKYLPFYQSDKLTLLEIGVLRGESLRMWADYFPKAKIVGIDINPECKKYEKGNILIETGCQDDFTFIRSVIEKYGPFHLVIDDGSHMQNHVIVSFKLLFPSVVPAGIYVVEDTCCSYWKNFGGGFRKEGTTVEYFKKLVDDVNFNGYFQRNFVPKVARREDFMIPYVEQEFPDINTCIESVTFLNSMIMITKRTHGS